MRKKLITIIALAAALVLALGLVACTPSSGDDTLDAAVKQANARIASYHQTDAAFADTLMYYLPNSCVFDVDEGFLICHNGTNYIYNGKSFKQSTDEYTFFDTVQQATEAQLQQGQTVYTLGYHKKFDGGCARYVVEAKANGDVHIEANGLFLNYLSATNKISLPQMGWQGDDLWNYQHRFEGYSTISTLVFPKGEYPLADVVRTDRDNVNYFGIEATIYAADNFGGETNKVYNALWSVRKTWSSNKTVVGQTYSGLHFDLHQITYNPQEGMKGLSYLMQIAYCKDIAFYNCSYFVSQDVFGGELRKYDSHCFDCFSAWHNITFDCCSFENYAYTNAGGAIGFRDVYNAGCDNLVFVNNTVVASPRDECVALFAGQDKRFHPDDAVLGNGYIRNCLLQNNNFVALEAAEGLAPRTMFLTVGYQLSPVYDIKYLDNTFTGYCNSYFLHYCYCYGLTFKGNTVNIRQTGTEKKMTLIYHNDSPEAKDILVENNLFNLQGENFQLNCVTITSPYSDAGELTFKNNTINLPEGYAEKIIAGNATVTNNVFNLNRCGSVYYRTCGTVNNNTYNLGQLEKAVFEFYNADVKHDLVVRNEQIFAPLATCNILMFNGTDTKFNGHSLLFEKVNINIDKVDKKYYYLCWSTDGITDTVVPITFRKCTFGAYEGHLQIANGKMHILKIED